MNPRLLFCRLFAFSVLALSAQKAHSQEETGSEEKIPLAYLILDASSSMWGRIDDRPKIEIAKEVLSKLIEDLPKSVNTGLTVYGHRREQDCSDIEDLSPLGIMERREMIKRIKKITPKGKSPLTATIKHVIDKIKDYDGPRTIIMISDGVEACGQDPCALVRELKAANIDFRIEVIGLDVNEEAGNQLGCIARESGGGYQHVKRTAQLAVAQQSIGESAVGKEPVIRVQEYPLSADTPSDHGVGLSKAVPTPFMPASQRGRGNIVFETDRWLLTPFYWRLIDLQSGEEIGRYKKLDKQEVPTGDFILAWRQYEHGSTEIVAATNVSIRPGQTTVVPLHTAIRINIPNWVKPPRFWGLRDLETNEQIVSFTTFETFLAPPGEYELVWRQYESRAETISFGKVEIEAGKVNYFNLNSSIVPGYAEWVTDEPFYWGLKNRESGEWTTRFYGNLDPQLVPPGEYDVYYRLSEANSTDSYLGEVEVITDEETEFSIESGILLQKKDQASPPELVEFAELNDEDKEVRVVRLIQSFGPLPLKPGRYNMRYLPHGSTADSTDSAGSEEIEITENALLRINLDDIFLSATEEPNPGASTDEKAEEIESKAEIESAESQPEATGLPEN